MVLKRKRFESDIREDHILVWVKAMSMYRASIKDLVVHLQ